MAAYSSARARLRVPQIGGSSRSSGWTTGEVQAGSPATMTCQTATSGSSVRVRPGAAVPHLDVERDVQRGGLAHLALEERADRRDLGLGRLDHQLVVDLEEEPRSR